MKKIFTKAILSLLLLGGLQFNLDAQTVTATDNAQQCVVSGGDVATFNLSITAPNSIVVDGSVTIQFDFYHSWANDVQVELCAPGGSPCAIIKTFNTGGNGDFGDATGNSYGSPAVYAFSDANSGGLDDMPANSYAPPGAYEPTDAFSIFNGITPQGTWTLLLSDDTNGDDGCIRNISLQMDVKPINDDCANALSIDGGDLVTVNTTNATNVDGLGVCAAAGSGGGGDCATGGEGTVDFTNGVWYKYSSNASETITVATDNAGTTYDTEIIVYSGACGSLTCFGGDDDGGDGSGSSFDSKFCWVSTGTAAAPVDYYIYVDGHLSATGTAAISLDVVVPLPVELTSFQGEAMDKYNKLSWETASEQNTEMHVIERSKDGRGNWQMVGEINAVGNTLEAQHYEFKDETPLAFAYYRLKSVDFDGYTDYSDLILLERKVEGFEFVSVAPNPTRGNLSVDFQAPEKASYIIKLTNMIGQTVFTQGLNLDAGIYSQEIDMTSFANGVYFITIENGFEAMVHRIVKQ